MVRVRVRVSLVEVAHLVSVAIVLAAVAIYLSMATLSEAILTMAHPYKQQHLGVRPLPKLREVDLDRVQGRVRARVEFHVRVEFHARSTW